VLKFKNKFGSLRVKERVRAIPLLPLWAFVVCSRLIFIFTVTLSSLAAVQKFTRNSNTEERGTLQNNMPTYTWGDTAGSVWVVKPCGLVRKVVDYPSDHTAV
jgi:hypothetical protein